MRKEFNIKYRPDIEAGRMKVETRDGNPARIVCWDCEGDESIVALVKGKTLNYEMPYTFNKDGSFVPNREDGFDLFVVGTLPISSFEDIFGNYIRAACNYAKAGVEEEIDIHSWAAGLLVIAEGIVESAYLSKSKSAKPVWEWSEEDIDKMVNARSRKSGTTKSEMEFYRQGIKDTLKSRRPQPHWKPSEEQIYSLGTVVNGYDNCTVGSVGYNLSSLYDDLKKLI